MIQTDSGETAPRRVKVVLPHRWWRVLVGRTTNECAGRSFRDLCRTEPGTASRLLISVLTVEEEPAHITDDVTGQALRTIRNRIAVDRDAARVTAEVRVSVPAPRTLVGLARRAIGGGLPAPTAVADLRIRAVDGLEFVPEDGADPATSATMVA